MKVNAEIFRAAADLRLRGISVFAAFPRVRSLFDFAGEVEFVWFALGGPNGDGDVEVDVDRLRETQHSDRSLEGPISQTDICQMVIQDSKPMSWGSAIEAINYVRLQEADRGSWPMGRGYKPIYFLGW